MCPLDGLPLGESSRLQTGSMGAHSRGRTTSGGFFPVASAMLTTYVGAAEASSAIQQALPNHLRRVAIEKSVDRNVCRGFSGFASM